jgi:hypothetical protein
VADQCREKTCRCDLVGWWDSKHHGNWMIFRRKNCVSETGSVALAVQV